MLHEKKLTKNVKGPLYSHCVVCPFWATLKLMQSNVAVFMEKDRLLL